MVQDPGLTPFREFLLGSAPSCVVPPSSPLPVSTLQSLSSALPVHFSVLSSLQPSCPETTALLGNPSLQVVSMPYVESSVTSPLVLSNLWFQFLSANRFIMLYTTSLTLVFVLTVD